MFLICAVFSYKDFVGDRERVSLGCMDSLRNLFYVDDVRDTVLHHIRVSVDVYYPKIRE